MLFDKVIILVLITILGLSAYQVGKALAYVNSAAYTSDIAHSLQ